MMETISWKNWYYIVNFCIYWILVDWFDWYNFMLFQGKYLLWHTVSEAIILNIVSLKKKPPNLEKNSIKCWRKSITQLMSGCDEIEIFLILSQQKGFRNFSCQWGYKAQSKLLIFNEYSKTWHIEFMGFIFR